MIFRLDLNTDKARNARPNDVMNYYNHKLTYVLVHSFRFIIYKSFLQYKKNRQPYKKRTNQRQKRNQNTRRKHKIEEKRDENKIKKM